MEAKNPEDKGYKIIATSNYNSLFFTKEKGQTEPFSGVNRQNLVELLTEPAQKVNKENVLRTLKSAAGTALLIDTISHLRGSDKLPAIVAACWETGEDMSQHVELFITLAIEENSLVGIESLSVIEEITKLPQGISLVASLKKLNSGIQSSEGERKFILSEIHRRITELSKTES